MSRPIKIFGYGSLMNEDSLKETCPTGKILYPARLYGFIRVFNVPAPQRFCSKSGNPCAALNAEKSEWNEHINGVCIEIPDEDIECLAQREDGYELVQIEIEHFFEEKRELAFMYRSLHFEAHDFQENSPEQLEYLKICEEGCRVFGEKFLKEFKETTFIGHNKLSTIDL